MSLRDDAHDWQPSVTLVVMGEQRTLHSCAKCGIVKEYTHETFYATCWGDLAAKATSQGDNRPDNTGLDDGPYLPGQATRKPYTRPPPERAADARRRAWETRRHLYGQRGHR